MRLISAVKFQRIRMSNANDSLEQYRSLFQEPPPETSETTTEASQAEKAAKPKESESRAGRALAFAMDVRKFEIELYWKRATYFWAFIAAAFAAYALTSKADASPEPILRLVFACLGLAFSVGWSLANKGSKFWQNNWERHVDILEDMTLGPLYKIVFSDSSARNPLTAAAPYSVTKINQLLSVFVCIIWVILVAREVQPLAFELSINWWKVSIVSLTAVGIAFLFFGAKTDLIKVQSDSVPKSKMHARNFRIET
jgi:hypothetical protein